MGVCWRPKKEPFSRDEGLLISEYRGRGNELDASSKEEGKNTLFCRKLCRFFYNRKKGESIFHIDWKGEKLPTSSGPYLEGGGGCLQGTEKDLLKRKRRLKGG